MDRRQGRADRHRPSRQRHVGSRAFPRFSRPAGTGRSRRHQLASPRGGASLHRNRCADLYRPRRDACRRRVPDTLIVTTRTTPMTTSSCGARSGRRRLTEKPMATTAEICRRILDAERRTGRRVDVAFNYRFGPTAAHQGVAAVRRDRRGRLGRLPLVSRHQHGADYFRRWHAFREYSGSLLCTRRRTISIF